MKKSLILLMLLLSGYCMQAQTVQSSCDAPQEVKDLYQLDAQRLILRHYEETAHPEYDSVLISQAYTDTFLNALIAVYNSDLEARDTVVELFDIHTNGYPITQYFYLTADTSLGWVNQFENDWTIPTGFAQIDVLLAPYGVEIYDFWKYPNDTLAQLSFVSQTHINVEAICKQFNSMAGVVEAIPGGWWISFPDISLYNPVSDQILGKIYPDYVELIYQQKWGEALRNWTFRVYHDCQVEFMGASGSSPYASGYDHIFQYVDVYPVPFDDELNIRGPFLLMAYGIYDVSGQKVMEGSTQGHIPLDVSSLAPGTYTLVLQNELGSVSRTIMKR